MGRHRVDTVKITLRIPAKTHQWLMALCTRKGWTHGGSTPKIATVLVMLAGGEIVKREDGTDVLVVPLDKDI